MASTYWHKQSEEPLFPNVLWSRPENRQHAGKLLIIGGNLHGFAAPANAYQAAVKASVGTAKVLLPDALQKTVGSIVENGEFAPSTPSGSFSKRALAEWLDWSRWSDAVLLAGDLGRNSETAIAIEQFTAKYRRQLVLAKDAIDYFYSQPSHILERTDTLLVLGLSQLQKLARHVRWPQAISFDMGQAQLVEWLHDFTNHYACHIITYHNPTMFVAVGGQVSTTQKGELESWRVTTAASAAVWRLQNPRKLFEASTTALY